MQCIAVCIIRDCAAADQPESPRWPLSTAESAYNGHNSIWTGPWPYIQYENSQFQYCIFISHIAVPMETYFHAFLFAYICVYKSNLFFFSCLSYSKSHHLCQNWRGFVNCTACSLSDQFSKCFITMTKSKFVPVILYIACRCCPTPL